MTGRYNHVLTKYVYYQYTSFLYSKTFILILRSIRNVVLLIYTGEFLTLSNINSSLLPLFCIIKNASFFLFREFEVKSKLQNREKNNLSISE